MIDQADVDRMQQQLESLRTLLLRDRDQAKARLSELMGVANEMLEQSRDSAFEPAIVAMHGLLEALSRSLNVQQRMNSQFTSLDGSLRKAA